MRFLLKRPFAISLLLVASLLFVAVPAAHAEESGEESEEVRSVWVSCFDFTLAGLSGQPESIFRTNAVKLFDTIESSGCNTVYFHVRPYDDAIYPSNIFPWNKHMFPKRAPAYDALEILLEESHKRGVRFHAWINPYRVTQDKIRNPGKQSTINRIVNGVREILHNYDVDGIHFDDYFYPGSTHKQYKKYRSVSKKARAANVNKMIRAVYGCVKDYNPDIQFGVSPAGDASYCKAIGADVETWMSKVGYVDYIVPQIYWTNQYKMGGKVTKLFNQRLKMWNDMNVNGVPMYIGLGLYRAGTYNSLDLGWRRKSNNIASQVRLTRQAGNEGYVLFSYQCLFSQEARKEMANYKRRIVSKLDASTE